MYLAAFSIKLRHIVYSYNYVSKKTSYSNYRTNLLKLMNNKNSDLNK